MLGIGNRGCSAFYRHCRCHSTCRVSCVPDMRLGWLSSAAFKVNLSSSESCMAKECTHCVPTVGSLQQATARTVGVGAVYATRPARPRICCCRPWVDMLWNPLCIPCASMTVPTCSRHASVYQVVPLSSITRGDAISRIERQDK